MPEAFLKFQSSWKSEGEPSNKDTAVLVDTINTLAASKEKSIPTIFEDLLSLLLLL